MKSQDKVRWGVLGACGIAKRRTVPEGIVPATNAELLALMDVDGDGVRDMANAFGVRACTCIEKILDDDAIQAVYVATPNHLHKDDVLTCAQAGKHVLCEKPLALTTAEIQEMIAACKSAGVLLGVGFMMRFNVYHRHVRDLIQAGAFGIPMHARGQMTSWHPPSEGAWRHVAQRGGGVVNDVGSHVVDVMEMLFGRTKSVFCQCFNRVHKSPVEDTALLQLVFECGAVGMVDVSFCIPRQCNEYVLEVYGSKGAVKCKFTLSQLPGGDVRKCLLEDLGDADAQERARYECGYAPVELEAKNTYQAEIEAFSQAILDGTPAPVPGEDGLWNHLVIGAAYESARCGRPVAPSQ